MPHHKPPPPDINLVAGQFVERFLEVSHDHNWVGLNCRHLRGPVPTPNAVEAEFIPTEGTGNVHTFGGAWNGLQIYVENDHIVSNHDDFHLRKIHLVGTPLKADAVKLAVEVRCKYLTQTTLGRANINLNVAASDHQASEESKWLHHDHHPDHEPIISVAHAVRDAALKQRRWILGAAYDAGSVEQEEALRNIGRLMQNEVSNTKALIEAVTVRNSPEWTTLGKKQLNNTDGVITVSYTTSPVFRYEFLVSNPTGVVGGVDVEDFPADDHTWSVVVSSHASGKKVSITSKVVPSSGTHNIRLTARNIAGPSARTFKIIVA